MAFKITAIVVDDERPGREEMKYLLSKHEDVEVIGIGGSPREAKEMIDRLRPNVVFLDITMPEKTGFELLGEIVFIPLVVFVTAHSDYALRAFDHSALDYLLKPVTAERLASALDKVRKQINNREAIVRNLFLKEGNSYFIVDLASIDAIEAYGNYIKIHWQKRILVQPYKLSETFSALDASSFFRISRNAIINLNRVSELVQQGRRMRVKVGEVTLFCAARKLAEFKKMLASRHLAIH